MAHCDAYTHLQEEASLQQRCVIITLRECSPCARCGISRKDGNLDFNVKVSGLFCTTSQIVKIQHTQQHIVCLYANQTKDCTSVKFDLLVGSLLFLVYTVRKCFVVIETRSVFQ